jgi:hypothetical protein
MNVPIDDADWVVVASETELAANLPVTLLSEKPPDDEREEDPTAKCGDCLNAVFDAVKRHEPVALLISKSRGLLQIRFPATGRVRTAWRDPDGRLNFGITGSPIAFTVPERSPLADVVAQSGKTGILVVDPDFDGVAAVVRPWKPAQPRGFCETFVLKLNQTTALSKEDANALYCEIFSRNSVPPYSTGVPFRWAHSYCEAKAHYVTTVLGEKRIDAGKAWAIARDEDKLRIATTSRKTCEQEWLYHVAGVIRSDDADGSGVWVFDPTTSLEEGVLSMEEWQTRLGSGLGEVRLTTAEAYFPCNDEEFERVLGTQMEASLGIARCLLKCRSKLDGDPPYRRCGELTNRVCRP